VLQAMLSKVTPPNAIFVIRPQNPQASTWTGGYIEITTNKRELRHKAIGLYGVALSREGMKLKPLVEEVIDMKDFQTPMSLKEALGLLRKKFATKGKDLRFQVDVDAFKEENPDTPDVHDTQIQFPPYPRRMEMAMVLRLMVSKIQPRAAYFIRRNSVDITTVRRLSRELGLRAYPIALSPDGTKALAGGLDNDVVLRDLASGKVIHTFSGHNGLVESLVYSPAGDRIYTGEDRLIHCWDPQTGQELHRLEGHRSWIYSLAMSGDGRWLLSGGGSEFRDGRRENGNDFSVRLWRLPKAPVERK
jgi:hypothetical protein